MVGCVILLLIAKWLLTCLHLLVIASVIHLGYHSISLTVTFSILGTQSQSVGCYFLEEWLLFGVMRGISFFLLGILHLIRIIP